MSTQKQQPKKLCRKNTYRKQQTTDRQRVETKEPRTRKKKWQRFKQRHAGISGAVAGCPGLEEKKPSADISLARSNHVVQWHSQTSLVLLGLGAKSMGGDHWTRLCDYGVLATPRLRFASRCHFQRQKSESVCPKIHTWNSTSWF